MPQAANQILQTATDGATVTFDLSTGKDFKVTLAGSRTFVMSNAQAGDLVMIKVIQDATGSRTVTWPAAVKWAGGSAPTLTTTASKADMIYFYYDGTNFFDIAINKNY